MTDQRPQQNPRLTRLELHGFKSFATKTLFKFEPGITAIVGPNGSGKSNISDAVRWVLGETSYSALRSKKTEDVIFAGGKGKSPSGLAEVSVTFDNEDRWLPSEFAEVTVTRRAYRGGDNQYLINGKRVRLKDVAHLTASLGHSYTVVGQGLVDQALSQRAEERRGLFEHAADLTGLRLKVQEAERNLAEADANVTRLTDLLAEVEPTLKRLERAARQAKEWQGLRERLVWLQRGHYRRLLLAATDRLAAAEQAAAQQQQSLDDVRRRLDDATSAHAAQSADHQVAVERLETHDARLATVRDQARRVGHERDLVAERQQALTRRRADMTDTQDGLNEQVARVEEQLTTAAKGLAAIEAEVSTAQAAVDSARRAVEIARESRIELERSASNLVRQIAATERTIHEHEQRRLLLTQRLEASADDQRRQETATTERHARKSSFESDLTAHIAEDDRIAHELATLDTSLGDVKTSIGAKQAELKERASRLADLDKQHGQATNRLDVLQRVHDSGASLHEGPRNVMTWSRDGSLSGIRGTLATLITVNREYDTALEVALGGHLQDIVVDAWRDAEAAIGRLKQARGGRVTFQPIETVRQRGASRTLPREIATDPGVHGLASDLVSSDDDVAHVVRSLLGRIVVVSDLTASRRLMRDLPNGFSTVTLAGEIARAGGSVTGGSGVRESGVLGRERELRDLPSTIAAIERKRSSLAAEREAAEAALQSDIDARAAAESARAAFLAQQRERAPQRQRLTAWIDELAKQDEADSRRSAQVTQQRDDHDREIAAAADAAESATRNLHTLREDEATLRGRLEHDRDTATDDEQALAAATQALATLEERRRAEERARGSLEAQRRGLAEELSHRAQRAAELNGEMTALADQRARLETEVERLTAAVLTAESERTPLADQVSGGASGLASTSATIERERQALIERERAAGQHDVAVERARSDRSAIHQRIADDLEYENPQDLLTDEEETEATQLPESHEDVEREIQRLRDRLRRVGYVSDDVVEEYERESERHGFMTTQLADVQAAASSLRDMLTELHDTMQRRFEETFAKVAEAFSWAFTTLFGGGTARLVLTADEEGAPGGIDIVAQPPGKRLQGLSLLSGGERSLTAVALLFAILRVNPSPFVLLDEVDAALDEANVVRFRDELRTLASETQAIVITHNRGTVEIADTLYGITMGGDGVSQMLSIRLSDIPLDEDIDVRDLPAVSAGIPVR